MPTSAKLRLIADLMDSGDSFEVRTKGDEDRAWVSPETMRPDDFLGDKWELRSKAEPNWTLPEPPAGKQWHRDDWTEEMLPEGWRPLLLGEKLQTQTDEMSPKVPTNWETIYGLVGDSVNELSDYWFFRTRRPLPTEPVMVPLGPEDVPPGSVIRSNDRHWFAVTKMSITYGLWIDALHRRNEISWSELAEHWQIKRPGQDWQPCSKPSAP